MAKEGREAAEEKGGSGAGCPVEMYAGRRCGRPIHPAPEHDKTPVCLMHSLDPKKSQPEFEKEFGAILKAAGDGRADFTRFVFPDFYYMGLEFKPKCEFENAVFRLDSGFFRAKFLRDANFTGATFAQKADFIGAEFTQNAFFSSARFEQRADFLGTKFMQQANFGNTMFSQGADFVGVTFAQGAFFHGGKFAGEVHFEQAKFLGRVDFSKRRFRHDKGGPGKKLPGPVFSLAEFEQPEKVIFYKNNLSQAVFLNCDVSKVNFSLVEWRRRKGSRKRMLFEEKVDLKAAPDLKPTSKWSLNERHYRLIAELYQQLKKNYDERKDYWTAGDFHYGEMEMKRLATKPPGRFVRLIGGKILGEQRLNAARKWWHRHLSLVALYKYASQYGESYARPLLCLALVLVLFTFLFPIVVLDLNDTKSPPGGTSATQQTSSQTVTTDLSYSHFSNFVEAYPRRRKWLARPAFFGNSLMTALSVAGFQKELKYEPSYPWGRVLALLELLLTSTLAALFLLAVRRQFRR